MADKSATISRGQVDTDRRALLLGAGALALTVGLGRLGRWFSMPAMAAQGAPRLVTIVSFGNDGKRLKSESVPMVVKTETEWRKLLSADSFEITRHAGTERPFTGALLEEHRKGVFRCICCDTALYDSATKFESGTGWPSFYQPIAKENVVETTDTTYGMSRTAISCTRCEAHLGHVFDDGPPPTGLRYCMNSVALRFASAV